MHTLCQFMAALNLWLSVDIFEWVCNVWAAMHVAPIIECRWTKLNVPTQLNPCAFTNLYSFISRNLALAHFWMLFARVRTLFCTLIATSGVRMVLLYHRSSLKPINLSLLSAPRSLFTHFICFSCFHIQHYSSVKLIIMHHFDAISMKQMLSI